MNEYRWRTTEILLIDLDFHFALIFLWSEEKIGERTWRSFIEERTMNDQLMKDNWLRKNGSTCRRNETLRTIEQISSIWLTKASWRRLWLIESETSRDTRPTRRENRSNRIERGSANSSLVSGVWIFRRCRWSIEDNSQMTLTSSPTDCFDWPPPWKEFRLLFLNRSTFISIRDVKHEEIKKESNDKFSTFYRFFRLAWNTDVSHLILKRHE